MTKRNNLIWTILVSVVTHCMTAPSSIAQDPIRVETNEVLVPTLVIDKVRLEDERKNPTSYFQALSAGNIQLASRIVESIAIRGLTASDFRLFEDGQLQAVQNVSYQRSLIRDIRDNKGFHTEFIGSGGGKWSSREWPAGVVSTMGPSHYLIAYAPPKSPEGSCHKIKIEVDRSNALVLARGEYCNMKHLASDPLNGTPFGKQMESDLASVNGGKVGITLTATELYTDGDGARIHIALDWPWKSLESSSRTLGVLGMVLTKDGSLKKRFSDIADFDAEGVEGHNRVFGDTFMSVTPTRYETQLILAPGEYQLQVVLGDGRKFGRSEMPLTVDSYDRKALAISAVSLCKQIEEVPTPPMPSSAKLPDDWTDKLPGSYVPLVSNDIEFKVTSNTQFKTGEIVCAYFEVFEPLLGGESSTNVQIQIRVVDLKSREAKSDSQPISATPYVKAGNPVIPIGRGINIKGLPKGPYRLDVRATDSTGRSTDWRSANFTVE